MRKQAIFAFLKNQLRIAPLWMMLIGSTAFGAQIALPTLLSNLDGTGDFVVVGGLTFDSFTYARTGDMPAADGINVISHIDADGYPGLRFQGGFLDLPTPGPSDALISYSIAAPRAIIRDVHLGGNPALLGGAGLASVTETFLPQIDNESLVIFDNGTVKQLSDWYDLPAPVASLSVQKDVILNAESGGAGASISFVDQTYSLVPEPTSLMGMIIGCLVFGMFRRRR